MSQPPTSPSPDQPDQPDQPVDRSERPEPPPYYLPPPPPPPAAPGPEARRPGEHSRTISILALVFGGAAVLFSLIPVAGLFLGGLFGIAAIVLGIVGIFISHRLFAIIGIALAIIGLIIAIIITIAVGKSAEKIIEDWPTNYEDQSEEEEGPEDEVVDGTDPTAPLPAGTEIETGNWRVVISNVVPDAAEAIAAEAEYYAPPAEGYQYYMFQVDATYEGQGSAVAWDELAFGVYFNQTLNAEYCEATLPNDLWEAPEVYTDGTATGNHCVAVPREGVEDAVISVEEYWSSGERYFVSAS